MALGISRLKPATRQQKAKSQSDAYYARLVAGLPTDARVQQRSAATDTYLAGLASGLADALRGSQVAVANTGNAAPGLFLQSAEQGAQTANAASAAVGGGQIAAPTAAARSIAATGANVANAMAGMAPAAIARGNVDRAGNRRATDDLLADLDTKRAEAKAESNQFYLQTLDKLREQAVQEAAAMDQSAIAWNTLHYNQLNADEDRKLGMLKLEAAMADDQTRAGIAQQNANTAEGRLAIMQQNADTARAALDAQIARDRKAGRSTAGTERRAAINAARGLVTQLRQDMKTTPGTPGTSDRTEKRKLPESEWTVTVTWVVPPPPGSFGEAPKTESKTTTVRAVEQQRAEEIAANSYRTPGLTNVQGHATNQTPLYEDVVIPGRPGTEDKQSRLNTDDQIRGQVFQWLRALGWSTQQAKATALTLVPKGKKGGGGGGTTGGRQT